MPSPSSITYTHVMMRDLLTKAYGVGLGPDCRPELDERRYSTDDSNYFTVTATMPKDT